MGKAEVMGASAEIGLLGNGGSGMNLHHTKTVSMCTVAETGFVVQGEVPGMLDAGALMHEGLAVDGAAETAKDEKPPRIEGLGGPTA